MYVTALRLLGVCLCAPFATTQRKHRRPTTNMMAARRSFNLATTFSINPRMGPIAREPSPRNRRSEVPRRFGWDAGPRPQNRTPRFGPVLCARIGATVLGSTTFSLGPLFLGPVKGSALLGIAPRNNLPGLRVCDPSPTQGFVDMGPCQ